MLCKTVRYYCWVASYPYLDVWPVFYCQLKFPVDVLTPDVFRVKLGCRADGVNIDVLTELGGSAMCKAVDFVYLLFANSADPAVKVHHAHQIVAADKWKAPPTGDKFRYPPCDVVWQYHGHVRVCDYHASRKTRHITCL